MKSFVLTIMALLTVPAVHAATVKQTLHATGVVSGAQGQASFALSGSASRGRRGKLKVLARHLPPGKSFGISVAGVRIGTLTTNSAGTGSASFSNPRKGHSPLLGLDPQGHLVEVSDDQGEDVLEGDMPDDMQNQGGIQCCLTDDDGEAECEEATPAECTAENGTNMGAGSCFPNPCATSPGGAFIVCCTPDDDGPECDTTTAAECAGEQGVNLGAGTCEPNPCAPTMPGVVRCCVPENDDAQGDENQQGNAGECEQLTATECSDEGGTAIGPGACEPNPCPTSPSGAFLQ
jgi:hypothetical protein